MLAVKPLGLGSKGSGVRIPVSPLEFQRLQLHGYLLLPSRDMTERLLFSDENPQSNPTQPRSLFYTTYIFDKTVRSFPSKTMQYICQQNP